ncbi:hypothetical protein BT69DRAFT_1277560 [Atractiella rhizophila]|nr:hypothetical protein BT69DRAFT_1277560 [Atractiella rhizophila]
MSLITAERRVTGVQCSIVDTACTAVTLSCSLRPIRPPFLINLSGVYGYTVTHWGEGEYLLRQRWEFPAYLLLTATVAIVVQTYFIQRYFRLSQNFILTGVLIILALLALAGAISLSATVARGYEYSERNRSRVKVPAILWVGPKAVCDVAIATTLIVHLLRYRSKHPLQQTRKLISTLCILAIETSTPTALIAVAGLITYLQNNSSNASVGIAFNLGRAYSITFLMNLVMRQSLATPNHLTADHEFALPKSIVTTSSMFMNAISVQQGTPIQVAVCN